MCGLCGFGLADAELVLGTDISTKKADSGASVDAGRDKDQYPGQHSTLDGITAETIQSAAGPLSQPTDGFVAALWVWLRQAFAGQPSPSHGL